MSQKPCSVCRHEKRPEIDSAIVDGETSRPLAKRINAATPGGRPLSHDAINRHRRHVGKAITKALARKPDDTPDALADRLAEQMRTDDAGVARLEDAVLRQIMDLQERTLRILTVAEASDGDARTALGAIHQARENTVFLSKLLADLKASPKTSEADAMRVMFYFAEDLDVPVDELVAECERVAALQADIMAGRIPPHTARLAPPLPAPPAYVAPPPPPAASPVIVAGVPPPLPSADDQAEVPALLVLGHRPWHVVI